MDKIITIFCSFTRGWAIERWVDNLKSIDYPKNLINLAAIVDIDDPWIATFLDKASKEYRDFKILINRDWLPNEVRPIERRRRIVTIKEQSKDLIDKLDGDFIFGLEDDTVFENLDLNKFLNKFDSTCGMIEGVQMGRWRFNMIGAWKFDNIDNPTEVITLLPKEGYEEIDAGGFYGYLTTKKLYLDCPYSYNNEPWGPDVNYGLWLRRKGLINYIDWEIKFGHNEHNVIIFPYNNIVQYKFKKIDDTWFPVVA